jgi:hypothetical protein
MGAGRAIKTQQSKKDSKQTRSLARRAGAHAAKASTKAVSKVVKPVAKEERKRVVLPPAANSNPVEVKAAPVPAPAEPAGPVNAITWDDPQLDRRIIEGMLTDRGTLMDELASKGITGAAVVRRAADLGLSEAYLRHVQTVAADLAGDRPGARRVPSSLAARDCLSCNRVFLSSGPGNRICPRCRGADAGLAQL